MFRGGVPAGREEEILAARRDGVVDDDWKLDVRGGLLVDWIKED